MWSGPEERAAQNQVLQITSISICFIFMCPSVPATHLSSQNTEIAIKWDVIFVICEILSHLSSLSSSVSGPKIWPFGNASGPFWFFHPGSGSGSGVYYAANNTVWRCVYWVQWSTIPCLVLALFTGTGGDGGGAKYQISGDEKCQNPFTGKLATLPGPTRHGVANILPRQGVNNLPFIIISFDCSGITLSVTRP